MKQTLRVSRELHRIAFVGEAEVHPLGIAYLRALRDYEVAARAKESADHAFDFTFIPRSQKRALARRGSTARERVAEKLTERLVPQEKTWRTPGSGKPPARRRTHKALWSAIGLTSAFSTIAFSKEAIRFPTPKSLLKYFENLISQGNFSDKPSESTILQALKDTANHGFDVITGDDPSTSIASTGAVVGSAVLTRLSVKHVLASRKADACRRANDNYNETRDKALEAARTFKGRSFTQSELDAQRILVSTQRAGVNAVLKYAEALQTGRSVTQPNFSVAA